MSPKRAARACAALIACALGLAQPARAQNDEPAAAEVRAPTKRAATKALAQLKRTLSRKPEQTDELAHIAARIVPLTPLRDTPASDQERALAEQLLATLGTHATRPELAPYVAQAHALRGDYAQVLAVFAARNTPPDERELAALLGSASVAAASDRPDLAEQVLRVGLGRAPSSPPLLGALGLALLAQGRVSDALPLLAQRRDLERMAERARHGGPNRTFAGVADLAYALMASGSPEEASALLESECNTRPLACASLRVRAALESEQVREALEIADDALARAKDDVGMLYLSAEAATRLGDFPRARSAYTRILELRPGERRAAMGLESLPNESALGP